MNDNRNGKNRKIYYIIFLILILIMGFCFLLKGMEGRKEHIEGDDINIITNRFEKFSNIIGCYYIIDILSGGVGPTGYNMKALIFVDEQESVFLKEQYIWKMAQEVDVGEGLYVGANIEPINEWLYCEEFTSDILGNNFVGEVYFSKKENCIYVIACQ